MIRRCPEDTPCLGCKAIIPKGVQAAPAALLARVPFAAPVEVWFHLACAPPEYRDSSPATYSIGKATDRERRPESP